MLYLITFASILLHTVYGSVLPVRVHSGGRDVSLAVYQSLEELARIVDISYCVGTTGIHKPFTCLSRCDEFEGFELITTWNTGPLLSDSCGYIALSHPPFQKRVIIAFRGTYSVANTIADLSTNPAEYLPYPSHGDDGDLCKQQSQSDEKEPLLPQLYKQNAQRSVEGKCPNCTVHSGFMTSWRNTRCSVIPHVERALADFPDYELTLVGHSLGGAVATLAAIEFQARGWTPHVTTFGEPRVGNRALNTFIGEAFNLNSTGPEDALFRRVTHVGDPVPLLPPEEWGYEMHAGEIYISKSAVPPGRDDLQRCDGAQDPECIEGKQSAADVAAISDADMVNLEKRWGISDRYKLWELFFAHRDYFWRLGLCVPGGDPWNWKGIKYEHEEMIYE